MPGCEVCHKRLKRHARRFCSVICRSVVYRGEGHQTSKPHAACAVCGKPTKRPVTRFCSVSCRGVARRGSAAPNWRGGRYVSPHGYVQVPRNGQQIFEHRAVMEAHLGRPLLSSEHVHHRDGNRSNNAIENLTIVTRLAHARIHANLVLVHGWSKTFARCIECSTTEQRHSCRGRCTRCAQRLRYRQGRVPLTAPR